MPVGAGQLAPPQVNVLGVRTPRLQAMEATFGEYPKVHLGTHEAPWATTTVPRPPLSQGLASACVTVVGAVHGVPMQLNVAGERTPSLQVRLETDGVKDVAHRGVQLAP